MTDETKRTHDTMLRHINELSADLATARETVKRLRKERDEARIRAIRTATGIVTDDNQDSMSAVISDRRTITLRCDEWRWQNLDRAWREAVAEELLKTSGLDKEWEMTDCYADANRGIGISLCRRGDPHCSMCEGKAQEKYNG